MQTSIKSDACKNGAETSDSVNLGSNPSSPATTNADETGVSGKITPSEKTEPAEQTAHTGRTIPGTVAYRPSTGTEGAWFQDHWCGHCARDAAFRETNYEGDPALGCQILADSFAYAIDHPNYPKEWVYDANGSPKCTAFTTDPKCPVRCERTIDMFGATR